MRLSSLADYAVVMMTAAARRGGAMSAAVLATDTGVPLPTAQKLCGRLASAGLLTSARGAAGGVRLARPIEAISLADIIEAVEGPIAMTTCLDEERTGCALEGSCRVRPHWSVVNDAVRGALASVSLESLAAPGPAAPAPFVLSEVEGRAAGVALAARTSTSLSANGIPVQGIAL